MDSRTPLKTPGAGKTLLGTDAGLVSASWRWLILLGAVTMIAGVAAIVVPHAATMAIAIILGVVMMADGVVSGVHAMHMRGRRGSGWRALGALLSIMVGAALLVFPGLGIAALTLVVTVFLLAVGLFKTALALRLRSAPGWGWMLFNGVVALLLGALILVEWPQASAWVLGLFLGIELLISGMWLVSLGLIGRRFPTSRLA